MDINSLRAKEMKGAATRWERHWIWCHDHNHGKYLPPEKGPYASEFISRTVTASRRPGRMKANTGESA